MHLQSLPTLVFEFGHLVCNPARYIRYGHMNDILEENGKVLEKKMHKVISKSIY